ncbi:redoxin family protein [Chitinophaga sp. 22536]|uniref:redoxin family protein n=1 Tax=unclassified Chitinophaga TaxID=2619133 RepID=UPI003F829115
MMKSALYLACALVFTAAVPAVENPLEPGAALPKPDVKWMDVSGKEISLNSAKGTNGLLIVFGGNQCPYMARNQERLHNICALARKSGIGVVMVNSNEANRTDGDSFSAMKAYASQHAFQCYYILDKNAELADAFDANHTPECYLFDKNNRLVYKGAIDDNPGNADAVKTRHLQNAITELLAGKSITTNTSSTLGCNIKRNR